METTKSLGVTLTGEEELRLILDIGGGGEEPPEDPPTDEDPQSDEDPPPDTKDGEDDLSSLTPEQLAAEIKKLQTALADKDGHISTLNKEAADRRRALKKFEEEEKTRQRSQMDETERLKDELVEATSTLSSVQAELRKLQVQAAVGKAEVTSQDKAFKLIDPEDFRFPDDAELDEIPTVLQSLFKSKPHYFTPVKPESPLNDDGSPREENKRGKGKKKEITLPRQRL